MNRCAVAALPIAHLLRRMRESMSAGQAVSTSVWDIDLNLSNGALAFESLDYVYVPAADVDAAADAFVASLGAQLIWKVRGMGTTVACLRVSDEGRPSS